MYEHLKGKEYMEKQILKGIRQKNIRDFLGVIKREGKAERARIAKEIGVSLMTAGKIADGLLDAGVLIEEKTPKDFVGRRAGALSFGSGHVVLVASFTPRGMTAVAFDSALNVVERVTCEFNTELSDFMNCRTMFTAYRDLIVTHICEKVLYGLGIVVLGDYDLENDKPSDLGETRLASFSPLWGMEEAVGFCIEEIMGSPRAMANCYREKKSVLRLELCRGAVSGGILSSGELIGGGKKADLGALRSFDGVTLATLSKNDDKSDAPRIIAEAIAPLCYAASPELISIFIEDFGESDYEKTIKEEFLKLNINTDIEIESDLLTASRGVAERIIDNWFSEYWTKGFPNLRQE